MHELDESDTIEGVLTAEKKKKYYLITTDYYYFIDLMVIASTVKILLMDTILT